MDWLRPDDCALLQDFFSSSSTNCDDSDSNDGTPDMILMSDDGTDDSCENYPEFPLFSTNSSGSSVCSSSNDQGSSSSSSSSSLAAGTSGSTSNGFPWRLYSMLEDAPRKGFEKIVSWHTDNEGFRVHNPTRFVQTIAPQYFNQTRYKSFLKQLNLYGYTRTNNGPERGVYRHAMLSRAQPDLCKQLKRPKVKRRPRKSKQTMQKKTKPTSKHSKQVKVESSKQDLQMFTRSSTVSVHVEDEYDNQGEPQRKMWPSSEKKDGEDVFTNIVNSSVLTDAVYPPAASSTFHNNPSLEPNRILSADWDIRKSDPTLVDDIISIFRESNVFGQSSSSRSSRMQ